MRIEVAASAINRADRAAQRSLPPPPGASPIMGLECSGTVTELGEESRFAVGDEVCALLAGGGYGKFGACRSKYRCPKVCHLSVPPHCQCLLLLI